LVLFFICLYIDFVKKSQFHVFLYAFAPFSIPERRQNPIKIGCLKGLCWKYPTSFIRVQNRALYPFYDKL
jgi:hypothetical protein